MFLLPKLPIPVSFFMGRRERNDYGKPRHLPVKRPDWSNEHTAKMENNARYVHTMKNMSRDTIRNTIICGKIYEHVIIGHSVIVACYTVDEVKAVVAQLNRQAGSPVARYIIGTTPPRIRVLALDGMGPGKVLVLTAQMSGLLGYTKPEQGFDIYINTVHTRNYGSVLNNVEQSRSKAFCQIIDKHPMCKNMVGWLVKGFNTNERYELDASKKLLDLL